MGVSIKGGTSEPADSLVDICSNMYDDNRLNSQSGIDAYPKNEMKSDSRRVAGFSLDSTTGRLEIKMPERQG